MTEAQPTTNGGNAASGTLDLGAILGGPLRDPRALPKFLGGCLAVVGILFFGLGLLALLGYAFQTAQRPGRERSIRCPSGRTSEVCWVTGCGSSGWFWAICWPVLAVSVVVAILGFIPVLGGLANLVLGPLSLLLGAARHRAHAGRDGVQMVASNEIGSAFRIQENLQLIQSHLGTYVVFVLIVILIEVVEAATLALCGIGLIPGMFWSQAATGMALGRLARAIGV